MNKSKFLKRPLAALLAILMVVALVPMSAFAAAGDPDVIKVGGEEVKLGDGTATVGLTLPSGTSGIVENTLKALQFELRSDNGTTVGILDKDGKMIGTSLLGRPDISTAKKTVNVWEKSNHPTDTLWGDYTGMKLRVTEKGKTPVNYDLVITVSQRHASNDTTIESVTSTRIVDAAVDNDAKTIVITKPIGTDDTAKKLGLDASNFKPTNNKATITPIWNAAKTVITGVKVTAEDKSTQNYSVSYVVEKIFEEFDVKDIDVLNEVTEVEDSTTKGQVNIIVKVPYGTKADEIIPTFTPVGSVKSIQADNGFTSKLSNIDIYRSTPKQTTSGVANWVAGTPVTSDEAGAHAALTSAKSFDLKVRTSVSSNWDAATRENTGIVKVTFIPVKNPEAALKGVKVSTQSAAVNGSGVSDDTLVPGATPVAGNPDYNQVLVDVDSTYPSIIVGDIDNDHLNDSDNDNNAADIIAKTCRDVKLFVSADSKVTWVDPYNEYDVADITGTPGTFEQIAPTKTNDDYVIEFTNVDLRKCHNEYMHIKVESEDGENSEDYYLTFNGDPGTTPEIHSVTLHSTSGNVDISSTKDVDGNLIIHVPDAKKPASVGASQFRTTFDTISVNADNGATVLMCNATPSNGGIIQQNRIVNEKTATTNLGVYYEKANGPDGDNRLDFSNGCDYAFVLDANFSGVADGVNPTETATFVYVYIDDPSDNAVIDSIKLTNKTTLLDSDGNIFEGQIDPDKKTIRIEVPFSFKPTVGASDNDGAMFIYDWEFNGTHATNSSNVAKPNTNLEFVFDNLGGQAKDSIVKIDAGAVTTVEGEATYNPKAAGAGKKVRVWSEEDGISSNITGSTNETDTYYVYAVRQPANSEATLNNVTASAPVSVSPDTTVAKLNRYIISVPKNYNSQNGVSTAKEFELTFDRSEKSTVVNGQRTWCGADDASAKFKVADGKLYFNNEKVTVTDGRVIHFTVVAEDGRRTGEYEFVVVEGEASKDATISSVKVDENVSFTQDGNKFIVEDLSENENYDVTKLPVVIETNDPGATVTVDGKAYKFDSATGTSNITVDLSEGKTAEVVVTAADEITTATYTLSMKDGSAPVEKPSDKYTDLDKVTNDTMRDKVKAAIDMGIMGSTSSTAYVFAPKADIGRKDIAVIIARADLIASSEDIANAEQADEALKAMYTDGKDAFNDLAKCNDVQKAAIRYCAEKEIVKGDGASFNPDGKLTREEIAVILTNWTKLDVDKENVENTNKIADWNKISNWAKPYVNAVYGKMMNGTGTGFNPKGIVNREQTASVLVDAFGIIYPEFGN